LTGNLAAAEGEQDFFEPGIELPRGEGRDLILRACTRCHTLEGVPAYSRYWGFERWLPMVENMIEHGSKLDDDEKVIVARYLGKYFGTDK
jgi:hypothetical protein